MTRVLACVGHGQRVGQPRAARQRASAPRLRFRGVASETCPCGCGRRVGFNKRGAAKGYFGCTTMLHNATPVVFEMMKSVDERDAAELGRTLENIDRIRGSFLRHVHGEAAQGRTPTCSRSLVRTR